MECPLCFETGLMIYFLWQSGAQRDARVKGNLPKRTGPGSHHGDRLPGPEHVRGGHSTSIVFPTSGGIPDSGSFPNSNSSTICIVSRSIGGHILSAQDSSDSRFVEWWYQTAEEQLIGVAEARVLSHVPWNIVCASAENVGMTDTFKGVVMHSGEQD